MVTRLYLIRHCQSLGNQTNSFQGQTDADISETGEKQLALLGLRFRNVPLDAIYASPLKRAYKTACAVQEFHKNCTVQPLDDLMEIDVGELEGMPIQSVLAAYPEVAKSWDSAPWDCAFPGGESMRDVYVRAKNAMDAMLAAHPGETVAAASHGCLLRCALCYLLKGSIERLGEIELAGNTAVTELEISDGKATIVHMNDLSHLPEELRGMRHQYKLK